MGVSKSVNLRGTKGMDNPRIRRIIRFDKMVSGKERIHIACYCMWANLGFHSTKAPIALLILGHRLV